MIQASLWSDQKDFVQDDLVAISDATVRPSKVVADSPCKTTGCVPKKG